MTQNPHTWDDNPTVWNHGDPMIIIQIEIVYFHIYYSLTKP